VKGKNNFSFKWKVVENYVAAAVGLAFLWLFVTGLMNSDYTRIFLSLAIIAVAPFLVAYVDKKSARA
jgi:hypothetical protein